MDKRSYYITPYRMTRNPLFWRTLEMMKAIKPDQRIVVPSDTAYWLKQSASYGGPQNWTTISVENAVLCIKYSTDHLEYNWKHNPARAQKIMDQLIHTDKRDIALGNDFLREETLVTFLEKYLKRVKSDRDIDRSMRLSAVGSILGRRDLQTYQLELIWSVLGDRPSLRQTIIGAHADEEYMRKIPDYIFEKLLEHILSPDHNKYGYDGSYMSFIREGVLRGFLKAAVPVKTTINTQPRPATFPPALVETPIVPTPVATVA